MRNVDAGQKRDFLTRLVLGSDMYADTKYGAAREGHVLCNCAAGMLRDVLYAWIVGLRHEFVAILEKWKSKRFLASRDESRKYSVCTLAVFTFMLGCAPAYTITVEDGVEYRPPTEEVQVLTEVPDKPFEIVAEFKGRERWGCLFNFSYCTLRRHARELGANAIWIQSLSVYKHQDEWIMIGGRLTLLRHPTIETIRGVLIRYTD